MGNKIQTSLICVTAIYLITLIAPIDVIAQNQPQATNINPGNTSTPQPLPTDKLVIDTKQQQAPRVCVSPPLLKMVETSLSARTADEIGKLFIQFMSGPMVQVTPLESRIPVNIEVEAKMKNCDLVLYSTLTLIKNGGTTRVGSMLKKVAPATTLISLSGDKVTNMTATVARVAADVIGDITVERKKKDEVTFEYKLMTIGGAVPIVTDVQKARSKEDGEDILSPMLEKNAAVIVIAVLRYFSEETTRPKEGL